IFQGITWSVEELVKVSYSWAKQYTVYHKDFEFATIRRVLRDRYGGWILGYNRFLGIFSILDAELWGIWNVLIIALDRGFNRLIILSYNQEVVQAIENSPTK
ncbi:hypothetical protein Golax_021047, partial [Gossypium laxum]|nr:hypothetical protein [Gossypium laxum]